MSLSAHELRVFLEIAASKNLSRAAEKLATSQPALSMLLKRLETYFGVTLFLRTKHGLELTKPAIKLTQEAMRIVRDIENLKENVLKQHHELEGIYTLGFHPQVAAYSFPKFAKELLTKSNKLNIKLVYDKSRRILSDVVDFKIDFGIVVNPVPHPDLAIIKLYKDSVHFWSKSKSTPLQDLNNSSVILFYDQSLQQMEYLLSRARKEHSVSFQRSIHSPDLDVIREFVSHGLGIGILPSTIALKVAIKQLKKIEKLPSFDEQICLVYRADMQKSHAAKYIKNCIINACSTN